MTMMGLPYRILVKVYHPSGTAIANDLEYVGKTLDEAIENLERGLASLQVPSPQTQLQSDGRRVEDTPQSLPTAADAGGDGQDPKAEELGEGGHNE